MSSKVCLPFVRSAYNYDRNAASDESGLCCEDVSLTKQSFKEDADINVIMRRFGLVPTVPLNAKVPSYGDFSGIFDYQTALNAVVEARESFMWMPPELRARFHNDPQEFMEFCDSESNRDEAVKLGLVQAPAVLATPPGPASTPPTAGSGASAPVAACEPPVTS